MLEKYLVHIKHDRLSNLIEKIANQTHASVIYLSLKKGAGVKAAADGRTFYLWDDGALRQRFEKEAPSDTMGAV